MAIQEKEGGRVRPVGVIIQAENVLLPSVMLQAYSLLQVGASSAKHDCGASP